jgi:nitrogen regulatory protein PII-like uncharacterized protein
MRFDLIMGFIDPNNTQKVIKTAKKSGATGEVVIQGRGSGLEPANFMGLSINDKTEIVLFIVEEHHTTKILDSLSEECHIEEPGNGIFIVLNIDKVVGLSKQIRKIRENLKTEQL